MLSTWKENDLLASWFRYIHRHNRVHGTRPWLFFTAMQHRWTHDILDYTLRNEERLVGMCSNSKRFSKLNPSSFPKRPTSRKAETGEGERVRKAPQQARWLNVCMSVPDKHTSQPRPWKHSRHPNSTFFNSNMPGKWRRQANNNISSSCNQCNITDPYCITVALLHFLLISTSFVRLFPNCRANPPSE